ncbi:MAG TPA: polysaccharide biosynthesis tyrosine autokinase [Polyangiaceae bacterium]|nr:polysaccharide biosynthesis tyrosine autokinase [Polyangiaceae bacterium]
MTTPLNVPPSAASAAFEDVPSAFSPGEILGSVRKNWLIVVAVAAAITIGVAFFTFGQTKIYEAQSTVLFDPQQPRPLGDHVQTYVDTGQGFWSNKEYYRTQLWIIQSLRITSSVVRALGLNRDPGFLSNAAPGVTLPPRQSTVEDAAAVIQSRLSVEQLRDSRLAVIKYMDADPSRARRVLSSLVETYVQQNLDDAMESSSSSADWLRGQIGSLKDELEASEIRLHEYKKEKSILSVSMNDQSNMLNGEMRMLSDALTSIRTKREEVKARRDELAKVTPEDPMNVPATELMQAPMLQSLRNSYISAEQQIDSLEAMGKGEAHPEVKAVIGRREYVKGAFFEELNNIRGAIDRDLAEMDHEAGGIKKLFDEAESQALDVNLLEIEYNRLARARNNNEKLYSLVMERSKESDLTRTLVFNNLRIMEKPLLPRGPVSPNVPLNMAGGLVGGLLLGLVAAIGREQLDRSVKTPSDVEHTLGLTFLGLLPSISEKANGKAAYASRGKRRKEEPEPGLTAPELVVHEFPSSGIAEAARAIRTNILFMSPDRPYRTLLVTSAGPSEGKTTVACCIAIAMAQAGRRVVLIDCDMRRPRIHKVFGLSKDVGITTALLDPNPSLNLAVETSVPNLSVIATGPLPPNPAEVLHSEAFARILDNLKQQFDCVVIDSPPIVPVTDAAILSRSVDGTVLVVRAFQTTKDVARRAARALRNVGGHMIGTVLNAVDLDRAAYGYKYYYYYKRNGYASEEGDGPSPPGV